jgi:hemoglobin
VISLFDKYGGIPAVSSIVKSFYKSVLSNPKLKIYFENTNADKLIEHQIIFISHLLGKPSDDSFNAQEIIKHAHSGKKIAENAFIEIKETLEAILIAHKFEANDLAAVMNIIQNFQETIVELPTIIRTKNSK